MKSMVVFAKILAVSALALTVFSCSYFKRTGHKQPGFLGDYSELQLNYDLQGVSVYRNTKTPLSKYSSAIFEPVIVTLGSGTAGRPISPEELKDMSDYFRSELATALKNTFVPADRQGSGVARIRTAILNVTPGNPLTDQPSITTVGLSGASIEIEITDSVSKEKLFAMKETARGGTKGKSNGARELLGQWARLVRDKVETVLGK